MNRRFVTIVGLTVLSFATPGTASADWLLTGFVGPIEHARTTLKTTGATYSVNGGTGFGVNLAKAWAGKGGSGFELDWGVHPKFWGTRDTLGQSGRLMTISPSFFINPALPRFRPYGVIGPTVLMDSVGSGTDTYFGANFGGGLIVFANERFAGRVDVRYFRQFREGVNFDIGNASAGTNGIKNTNFWRLFFGGTVRLGS